MVAYARAKYNMNLCSVWLLAIRLIPVKIRQLLVRIDYIFVSLRLRAFALY
jgi:hypothetical protein